jgi:hypothetical protein
MTDDEFDAAIEWLQFDYPCPAHGTDPVIRVYVAACSVIEHQHGGDPDDAGWRPTITQEKLAEVRELLDAISERQRGILRHIAEGFTVAEGPLH